MKKKIVIFIIIFIPFISILLAVLFRGVVMPTNEEIVQALRDIESYEAEVEYIIKNSKDEYRENTKQYYSKENGVKIEFGDDLVKVYNDNKIKVTNNKDKKEYEMDSNMDIVHPLAFIGKILSYEPISELEEGQEEWGDTIYIKQDFKLNFQNDHLTSASVFIDKELRQPIGIIIYDKYGKDSIRIVYSNFQK